MLDNLLLIFCILNLVLGAKALLTVVKKMGTRRYRWLVWLLPCIVATCIVWSSLFGLGFLNERKQTYLSACGVFVVIEMISYIVLRIIWSSEAKKKLTDEKTGRKQEKQE